MFHWVLVATLAGVAASEPPPAPTDHSQQIHPSVHEEQIVITAALEEASRRDLPVSATVVERAEIRERQATQIFEVLRTVPGLDVVQSGSPGKVVSLFSRGSESNQSLVLWNGLPLNDPYFGGFDWAYMPTDGVGRVEVVRGPFSSLYGSEAMGAVVQVLSDRSQGGTARLEGGSDSYGRLGVAWGDDLGGVRFDLAGHARTGDGPAENDFYDGEDLMGRLEWGLGDNAKMGFLARRSHAETGIPVASGAPTPRRVQDVDTQQLAIPFEIELGDWRVEALLSRGDREFLFEDPDAIFSRSRTDTERLRARTVATWRAGDDLWIAGGAEWQEDEVTNESNFGSNLDGETRSDWAVFAEAQKRLGRFRLDLGIRQDDDEYFGSHVSPRAGLVADLSDRVQLFASYAEGFRAPSLGELFFPFFGNPDLEPEESESVEVGVRFNADRWWVGLAYFDNDFTNLIDSDPATFTAINVGSAETNGWELELGYAYRLVEVRANVTQLDATDLDSDLPLLRRAEDKVNLLVALRPEDWVFQLTTRYVGDREDLDPITFARAPNDSYFVADLAITWEASDRFAPYARVINLADEEYEEVLGFPALGRSWSLGLEARWP